MGRVFCFCHTVQSLTEVKRQKKSDKSISSSCTELFINKSVAEWLYIFYLYFENAKEALVPPKPNLFDKDTLTCLSWADNGT